jgi:hypothetical protein
MIGVDVYLSLPEQRMKKLKLDLDQVQVTSFPVETAENGGGTVNGFGYTLDSCSCEMGGCMDMHETRLDTCNQ